VKKISQQIKIDSTNSLEKIEKGNNIKTTNVNILLNRVRLDKKRDFKKKLVLFFIFTAILSSLIFLVLL
jgi:hypothetical protein